MGVDTRRAGGLTPGSASLGAASHGPCDNGRSPSRTSTSPSVLAPHLRRAMRLTSTRARAQKNIMPCDHGTIKSMMDANNDKKKASQTGKIEDADCGAATAWTISMPTNKMARTLPSRSPASQQPHLYPSAPQRPFLF